MIGRRIKVLKTVKIFLIAVFAFLWFADCLFSITTVAHHYTEGYEERNTVYCSFIQFSQRDPNGIWGDFYEPRIEVPNYEDFWSSGSASFGSDYSSIVFYILILSIIVDVVITLLVPEPKNSKHAKWKLLPPVLSMLLFVSSALIGAAHSSGVTDIINYRYIEQIYADRVRTVSVEPFFYLLVALCIMIVAIEVYIMILNRPVNSRVKVSDGMALQSSVVEELRTYKSLLDEGVITQEEFDAAKNRLLQ